MDTSLELLYGTYLYGIFGLEFMLGIPSLSMLG